MRGPLWSAVELIPEIDTTTASQSSYTEVHTSGGSFQEVCGKLIRVVLDHPFHSSLSLRLTFGGKCFATSQTFIFEVIIPNTPLYGICHCSLLAVNTSHIQMPLLLTKLLLCSPQALPFTSSHVFDVYPIPRNENGREKKSISMSIFSISTDFIFCLGRCSTISSVCSWLYFATGPPVTYANCSSTGSSKFTSEKR